MARVVSKVSLGIASRKRVLRHILRGRPLRMHEDDGAAAVEFGI